MVNTSKSLSFLSLLLLVPAPSIGILAGMVLAPNLFGKTVFFISKIWILSLPLFWHLCVDKQKLSLSKPRHGGFAAASSLGGIISAVILGSYFTLGRYLIEPQIVKEMAANIGLVNKGVYMAGACYWILINSALEEYVWRWFVVSKCKSLLPTTAAILVSAFCFTIHHIIAMQIYFNLLVVSIASVGIFIGGAAWSWCYNRYHSIWPGYISHGIVDAAVFYIGYLLIFG